jgi:hypothetical protein
MKFLAIVLSAVSLASYCDAYSLYTPAKANALSQKSVMQQTMGITRRETIQMPSTSPMVPYMVSVKCEASLAIRSLNEMTIHRHVFYASLTLVCSVPLLLFVFLL